MQYGQHFFIKLSMREKKTKNLKKNSKNTKPKNIMLFMPRGDSSYIDCLFVHFLCTKVQKFFLLLLHQLCAVLCTMSANFDYIYWPVRARMENYILITEYMSFTKN